MFECAFAMSRRSIAAERVETRCKRQNDRRREAFDACPERFVTGKLRREHWDGQRQTERERNAFRQSLITARQD